MRFEIRDTIERVERPLEQLWGCDSTQQGCVSRFFCAWSMIRKGGVMVAGIAAGIDSLHLI